MTDNLPLYSNKESFLPEWPFTTVYHLIGFCWMEWFLLKFPHVYQWKIMLLISALVHRWFKYLPKWLFHRIVQCLIFLHNYHIMKLHFDVNSVILYLNDDDLVKFFLVSFQKRALLTVFLSAKIHFPQKILFGFKFYWKGLSDNILVRHSNSQQSVLVI